MLRRAFHSGGSVALPKVPADWSRNSNVHLLPEYGWSLQADQQRSMVTSAVCFVDTGSQPRQHHLHGACDGCRESSKTALETELLHLRAEDGRVYTMWQQAMLRGLPRHLRPTSPPLSQNEISSRWTLFNRRKRPQGILH